jgi:hypothetical protein
VLSFLMHILPLKFHVTGEVPLKLCSVRVAERWSLCDVAYLNQRRIGPSCKFEEGLEYC